MRDVSVKVSNHLTHHLAAAAKEILEEDDREKGEASVQIEQQNFAVAADRESALLLDRRSVAGVERLAIEVDGPARHLQPCGSTLREVVRDRRFGGECRGEDLRVLMDGQRSAIAIRRGHEA